MDHAVLLGLAKLLEKEAKGARAAVAAGRYDLDETLHLHVSGTLVVGEDTEATPSHKIPWKTVFALFLHRAGVREENMLELLVETVQEALAAGDDIGEAVDAMADLEQAEALVQAGLDALPKEPRKGAVNAKGLGFSEVKPRRKAA